MSEDLRYILQTAATALNTDPPLDTHERAPHVEALCALRCDAAVDAVLYLLENHSWWTNEEITQMLARAQQSVWKYKLERFLEGNPSFASLLPSN